MTPLFSASGLQRLDRMAGPGLLCVFDFDGTLAPIVARPEHVVLPESVQERLIALSKLAPVAILTGRGVEDLRARLHFEPDFLIGNHGIEGVADWARRTAEYEAVCSKWADSLRATLHGSSLDEGIEMEDKRFSLSLHYRLAQDQQATARRLQTLFDQLDPAPRIVAGKCVFNLVPQGAPNKGQALEHLMRDQAVRNAMYVGDDITDEDVFRLSRPDLLSIRVERGSESAAEFYLEQRADVERLLDELITRLKQQGVTRTPL
jgi:trehalose 6-phosphate phosphatase